MDNYILVKWINACVQRAVWQDSGISPAQTAVRIWKLLPRRNVSEAATSPSRLGVIGKSGRAVRFGSEKTERCGQR